MFEAGSGEVLTPSRRPALTQWLARAVSPATPPPSASSIPSTPLSPANEKPSTAPISGRTTVWIESQAESRNGTLSVKNSTVNIPAAA